VPAHKVLVVDDEPDLLKLLEFLLRHEGYEVVSARDGMGALEAAQRERPDLILLDVVLPDMDGREVCRRLRNSPATAGTPIWMVSARTQNADIEQSLQAGADKHVAKPFKPRDITASIRKTFSGAA